MTEFSKYRIYVALEIAGAIICGRVAVAMWNDIAWAATPLALTAWLAVGAVFHARAAWGSW